MQTSDPQIPFYFIEDENGYVVYAVGQKVSVAGSPIVVRFDPPIAPTVDAGQIYQQILALLPRN